MRDIVTALRAPPPPPLRRMLTAGAWAGGGAGRGLWPRDGAHDCCCSLASKGGGGGCGWALCAAAWRAFAGRCTERPVFQSAAKRASTSPASTASGSCPSSCAQTASSRESLYSNASTCGRGAGEARRASPPLAQALSSRGAHQRAPGRLDDVGAHADGGEGLGGRAVARVDDDSDGGGGAYGRGAVTALPTPGSAATRSRMAEAARRR